MVKRGFAWLAVALLLGTSPTLASAGQQTPQKQRNQAVLDEATALTNGWALLAQGLVQDAAARAAATLAAYPHSIAALSLAVEADMARGGPYAGLDTYERWLGGRRLEEPGVVRRVARAVLRPAALDESDGLARLEALIALSDDGDADASAELSKEAAGANADTRALAEHGNETAVRVLINQLTRGNQDKVRILDALGESRSQSAAAAVAAQLSDPRDDVQAAALDALGKIGAASHAGAIRPFLNDQSLFVRGRAAAALYRLGDDSGLPILQGFAQSESPETRLIAADAMASRPDQGWDALVRGLLTATEPEVRVSAARLIAPHDPDAARATLQDLTGNANIAIREMAFRALSEALPDDLAALRPMLRSTDALTRVRAAARILTLTR
jgi:HEAT repeat protein